LFNVDTLWWSDKDVVTTLGYYLADWRKASQQFAIDLPDAYEKFPMWNEINTGWQTAFTPITIPDTPENFGIIHGDLHTGNWLIDAKEEDHLDIFEITAIDFDNAQRAWFVIDIGTVLFTLNQGLYSAINPDTFPYEAYHAWFYQFKRWLTDSFAERYGTAIPEDDLQQGCRWRKDFMYTLYQYSLPHAHGAEKEYMEKYCKFYESGNMPNC